MSTENPNLKRVLFVDDSLEFLQMIERIMGNWSQGEWKIFLAQNSGQALLALQENTMDLVVVDVQMPVVDGIQFLALLNRKYPTVQKVTLSAYADEKARAACLSNGAELFLEKPRDSQGLEIIFGTLRELARQKPASGFRGVLRQVSLEDVIQMECLNRNSSVLEIQAGKWHGKMYIREGAIVHAEVGNRNGEAALNKLLSLRGGEFNLKPFTEPPHQTLEGQWEFLLMEAARVRDETAEKGDVEPTAADGLEVIPEPPTQFVITPDDIPDLIPEKQDTSRPAQINEMVICSAKGEVLYDWQSMNVSERISFLEFLSQKSLQLGEGLNLGAFDRLEIEGSRTRIVAQITPDRGIFLRTSRGPAGSPSPSPSRV
ncbi:response regulator [Pedosphaera parvula]|uniref:Response regulator receiver protein n=1 Tax=Pedosphaera parvula (strain Ellin514) TaxID=320771 RepID=B9XHF9_PEDPL|nr:response regulator [Pedosphaera parvula]EEF60794.1 response regulator receiver protein [Pedosphaera parvula Ellin514]